MAKKRKHDSKVTEPTEPPKKQQQKEEEQYQQKVKQEPVEELVEEAEEYEEQVEEEEVEEEVEEEEEEEEEDDDEQQDQQSCQNQISSSAAAEQANNEDDDEDPIETLLEPFSKEQLINLLREAADNHQDVADRIRRIADEDPVHRKIFVHGLGWDTNAETLINAFKLYGEIEDCKAVSDKVSGKSKGYGFILFKRRSGARKALKEPQKKIGNRMTACQLASIGPVPTAPSAPAPLQQQQVTEYTQRKIYVSNVGSDLDPQDLLNFFAKYGEIEEGPLGLDKQSGKPKGFCLFVYRHVEGARRALEEPHKNFEGHILHCQRAIDGPKPGKSQQQQQHHHHHNANKSHFQRNNPSYSGSATGPAHLMAPAAVPGIGFNQGAAAAPGLNPALGQALTALLATQGAGLGLTNLLGSLGSAGTVTPNGVPGAAPGMQSAYGSQASPGVMASYGNQGMMQGGYSNQQVGQGSSGRGQHGVGQYAPYMGH